MIADANHHRPEQEVGQAGDHLQRHIAIETIVLGHVDHAHTAAAKRADDAVTADLISGIQFTRRGALGHLWPDIVYHPRL